MKYIDIKNMKVSELMFLPVSFISKKTKRKRKAVIYAISKNKVGILDKENILRNMKWEDIIYENN